MGLFSDSWKAVTGKINQSRVWGRPYVNSVWTEKTIDYTKNDYDLYRSIYYGVSINSKAKNMLVGAMFAKAIVNTTAGFALGNGFTVELDDKNKDAEQAINEWIDSNKSEILSFIIHGVRDGDSYLYVDEYGNLEELDAKYVTAVIDPKTGLNVGYDVEEYFTLIENGNERKYVVVKQYRTDSVKYTQYPDDQKERTNGTVIYSRVYTVNGAVEPSENEEFYVGNILPRPLPVIHFANDKEPRSIYGNSEFLNCLLAMTNYHAVMSNATKGIINNANPIPVMTGVKDASAIAAQSNKGETEDTDKVNWSPDTILFIENPEADAKYIQANGFMDDVGKLLEYYFYLVIEASETPEFIFGTAVSSSKASVSEQMPTVVQKATRKRGQLEKPLKQLVEAYVDRRVRMSDTVYLSLKNQEYKLSIQFPDIVDEDMNLTLDVVKYLNEAGILSDETAMRLLLNEKVTDIEAELTKARKDNAEQAPDVGAVPFDGGRLQTELIDTKKPVKEMLDEIVAEYNKNHDKLGRFASGNSGGATGNIADPNAKIVKPTNSSYGATSFYDKETRKEYLAIVTKDSIKGGGITVPLSDVNSRPKEGLSFAPSKTTERIVPASEFNAESIEKFIKDNKTELSKPNRYVGNWYNEADGNYYLDVAEVGAYSAKTIKTAQKAEQLAVFDLKTFNEITIGKITKKGYNVTDEASTIYDKEFGQGNRQGTSGTDISPVGEYYAEENSHKTNTEKTSEEIVSEYNKNHDELGRFTFGDGGSSKPRARDTVPEFMGDDRHAPTKIAEAYNLTHKPTPRQLKKIVTDSLDKNPAYIKRYNDDRSRIKREIDIGKETYKIYGTKFEQKTIIDPKTGAKRVVDGAPLAFSRSRMEIHTPILTAAKQRIDALPVTKPPVLIVIMGRPGSGKSSFRIKEENSAPWAVWSNEKQFGADPDYFKEQIGKYDKKYANPITAGLTHEESSYLYKQAVEYAKSTNKSIVMDQTLASDKYAAVKAFADAGYDVKLYGVSTSVGSSVAAATTRYIKPIKDGFDTPDRLVPPEVSASNTTNEANFEKLIPLASEYKYYTSKLGTDEFAFNLVAEGTPN